MDDPVVSVVIPAYNQPEMLREALESVAAQDHPSFEVVVVDDGSPRDLSPAYDAVRDRLGERLRVVRQENAGGSAARNRGVALARGAWVALLDHDDLWLPSKLRRQLEVAEQHPQAAMVYCKFERFGGGQGRVVPREGVGGRILEHLVADTLIRTLSVVLIRRDALGEEPWFDLRYLYSNDIDLYYRIAERHEVAFVDEVLVRKRAHEAQASWNRLEAHDESVAIVERLAERLRAQGPLDPDLERRLRERTCRHLLGAAKAARARGDREGSRRRYREVLARDRWHLRAWRGYLGALL